MQHNMLRWACPPQLLTPNERINNILSILQDLRIFPIELLMTTLGSQIQYIITKELSQWKHDYIRLYCIYCIWV